MPSVSSSSVLPRLPDGVWLARALAGAPARVVASGHAALDAALPGAGWPVGALTELLQPPQVHNEWRLLLPALARCGQGAVVLIGAAHVPFAPALAAQGLAPQRLLCLQAQGLALRLWAAEQVLRCAQVDAVLLWLPQPRAGTVHSAQLRRLQLAAAEYGKLFFVMRPEQAQHEASPATLRLHLAPLAPARSASGVRVATASAYPQPVRTDDADALQVALLKRRGPALDAPLRLQARAPRMLLLLAASQTHALDRLSAQA